MMPFTDTEIINVVNILFLYSLGSYRFDIVSFDTLIYIALFLENNISND